jgi:hypothetical protein
VRENGVQGGQVAVDVRDDGYSHDSDRLPTRATTGSRLSTMGLGWDSGALERGEVAQPRGQRGPPFTVNCS